MKHPRASLLLCTVLLAFEAGTVHAAGTLTPVGRAEAPIQIRDHHLSVVLLDGFARTEVTQTFFNPNDVDLEAIYSFPVPSSASLSEVTIFAGERELRGEVLERDRATEIYEEERDQGHDAGLATQNGYQSFDFAVSPVPAGQTTQVRFVYYQPIALDTGVGRYVYPLEGGGTDDLAASFWQENPVVEESFSAEITLRSSWPLTDVRVPGREAQARIEELETDLYRISLDAGPASLDRDLVVYWRLADDLPGRVELIPYRASRDGAGTFMLVLTPGIDLQPLTRGSDYTFVLDTSGSMEGKIATLARGVGRALGELRSEDRFRIVTFSSRARRLTRDWVAATPENVERALREVEGLRADGSTNLYEGLELGLDGLDSDRASSVVLVTDGVTNTGIVDPKVFYALMKKVDVRVFGFLLGNQANWPLMRTICDASGGFYAPVSNQDDLLGQLLLAKSKVTHEALHDARLEVSGVRIHDSTEASLGKVYRGEQVVIFGRYEEAGRATIRLEVRLSGEDKTYVTTFDFPEVDTDYPEIERLWALDRIEGVELHEQAGLLPSAEARDAIRDLGVAYQLVSDETAMVVLVDEAYQSRGIERRNRDRVARERAAQGRRSAQPVRSHRVDEAQPMFPDRAPRLGGGGSGAVHPLGALIALLLAATSWWFGRRGA